MITLDQKFRMIKWITLFLHFSSTDVSLSLRGLVVWCVLSVPASFICQKGFLRCAQCYRLVLGDNKRLLLGGLAKVRAAVWWPCSVFIRPTFHCSACERDPGPVHPCCTGSRTGPTTPWVVFTVRSRTDPLKVSSGPLHNTSITKCFTGKPSWSLYWFWNMLIVKN